MSVLSIGAARAAVITVAAASALALLALPSAAHAAEVVTCTKQATAQTQPWLVFSQGENFYEPIGVAEKQFITTTSDLTLDFPALFTSDDLDAYKTAVTEAEDARDAVQAEQNVFGSLQELAEQLNAVDPDNTTGWQQNLPALFNSLLSDPDLQPFQTASNALQSARTDFLNQAQATLDADLPAGGPYTSPLLPEDFEANVTLYVSGIDLIVSKFQTILLDGAAQFVVYEDVCTTTTVADTAAPAEAAPAPAKTLAATGSSDGLVLGTVSGMLLLVGAASLILVRRRSA
ncbi:LPXTG-motif cell wall anchor domain-containing protein [Agreia bicolorata]|uniref:LPXTG-motif cell wall anchor domain-containing protein n=1 Tax=Agreia bicolorata TaxID=110935 RepID=A0A1T4WXJ8_9MICO|nr:LPXTG cell wall anchor domain-containing protein [Agreia bicolorata]SKA81867.1 LPXTG-motif cell wall anchor domain-containing protein [Agreia bicolorata]